MAIADEFRQRQIPVDFRATGQTGILIAGRGIPMDAVVSDFLSGAAEIISPSAAEDHWDVIEGQGSLFYPAYAAVTLGLLHGSQPDILVLCHEAGRETILGSPSFPLPPLTEAIELYLHMARRTNPSVRFGGVSINTLGMTAPEAEEWLMRASEALHLPVADPIRRAAKFCARRQLFEGNGSLEVLRRCPPSKMSASCPCPLIPRPLNGCLARRRA